MSYILDALKKAEQERDLGRVPRLETVHDNTPRPARVWPWLSAGILLINAAALLWWLRPGMSPEPARPARQAQVPAAVAPAPMVTTAPAALPNVTPPVATAPATAMPPHAAAAMPVVPAITAPPPVAEPAATVVPLLRDLPADLRAAVPSLSLDVHVYAASPAARFVLINMKKYHEGEQLAEGPRVAEITEEGVIFSYQGQQFRIARP